MNGRHICRRPWSPLPVKKFKKSSLYLDKKYSDVTLIVEGEELPAHKNILTKGSEYFKTMFSSSFFEATSDKVVLKETKLRAFKFILKHIYDNADGDFNCPSIYGGKSLKLAKDGKDYHSPTQLFDILACARFYMVDKLVNPTIWEIKLKKKSLGTILTNAFAYFEDELITYSTDEIQENAHIITKIYKQLSPEAMEHLLKLSLNTRESTIFEALVGWMRYNFNSSDIFLRLLEYIELPLLDEKQLNKLFKPKQLVDRSLFQELLDQQRKKATPVQKVVNENVVSDLRIVEGRRYDVVYYRNELIPLEGKTEVIIDLKQQFLLNCLKMISSHYAVSVSTDMRSWELVFNYLDYSCFGQQVLYFDERVVRFIRFQKKRDESFSVRNIEATYSTNSFNYDPDTTLLIPTHDSFLTEGDENLLEKAFVKGTLYADGGVGHLMPNDRNFESDYDDDCIIAHQRQPYLVESIRIMLPEKSSYRMEISTDQKHWTTVKTEKNVMGWRIATFPRQPVVCIKIAGLKSSSQDFYIRNLECPAHITAGDLIVPEKTAVSHHYALRKRKAPQA